MARQRNPDLYVSAFIVYRLGDFVAHLAKTEKHKIVDQSGQSQAQNVIWIPYSVLICLLDQRDVQLKKIGETCRVQQKGIELVAEGDALGA